MITQQSLPDPLGSLLGPNPELSLKCFQILSLFKRCKHTYVQVFLMMDWLWLWVDLFLLEGIHELVEPDGNQM